MKTGRNKIFIGFNDIANIPILFKQAFKESGLKCDYFRFSNEEEHPFGYSEDRTFRLFKYPPPFRIFGKNPFWIVNKILVSIFLFYSISRYKYFFFISPRSFYTNNKDLPIIKLFGKKVIMIFTGCVERDVNFAEADEDYICKKCQDISLQNWCLCNDANKKKELIGRLEKYSNKIIGQDDITSLVVDKSKLIWLYLISDYPKYKIDLQEKYNQKEIRIIHFPSNPLVKQSHIIIPILNMLARHKNVKIIIKDGIWKREKIEEELSKAHILVNALGAGYNTLPIEAMSYGCVVFNSQPHWFQRNVPDSPIVAITADNLEDTLIHYINNIPELKNYAEKSIDYYKKYHSPVAVGNFYKKILEMK